MARAVGVLMLLSFVSAAPAAAQPAWRAEVSGGAAFAKTWDDEGSIGLGGAFNGTVLFPLTRSISIGGTVDRITHDRETGSGSLHFQGDSTLISATGKFTFGEQRVRPFLSAGFGILRYSGVLTSGPPRDIPPFFTPPAIPVERFDRSGTSTVATGTSGVDIWITRNIAARPFATLHMTQPNEDFMPWMIISGGVSMGVRW